jgi:transcriptional regulator with XRE-family HTH domain
VVTTGISSFGDRLSAARRQAGLTREATAEAIGRSADTVASWEQGRCKPRPSTLVRLAETLGVSAADLGQ